MTADSDSTQRFSDRVEAYVKYRPGYPVELVTTLLQQAGLGAGDAVADIGAGTGIFSRLLLEAGLAVTAVEPNAAMRAAMDAQLSGHAAFHSVGNPAESTGLENGRYALVSAAQAFHWFATPQAVAEFRRILRPGGELALIWNRRRIAQPLQEDYDRLLREFAPEYGGVNHMNLGAAEIETFFTPGSLRLLQFDNRQLLDFDGLIGRLQSASYCPATDSPQYAGLHAALADLFARYEHNGRIAFEYETDLFLGNPAP